MLGHFQPLGHLTQDSPPTERALDWPSLGHMIDRTTKSVRNGCGTAPQHKIELKEPRKVYTGKRNNRSSITLQLITLVQSSHEDLHVHVHTHMKSSYLSIKLVSGKDSFVSIDPGPIQQKRDLHHLIVDGLLSLHGLPSTPKDTLPAARVKCVYWRHTRKQARAGATKSM